MQKLFGPIFIIFLWWFESFLSLSASIPIHCIKKSNQWYSSKCLLLYFPQKINLFELVSKWRRNLAFSENETFKESLSRTTVAFTIIYLATGSNKLPWILYVRKAADMVKACTWLSVKKNTVISSLTAADYSSSNIVDIYIVWTCFKHIIIEWHSTALGIQSWYLPVCIPAKQVTKSKVVGEQKNKSVMKEK